MLILFTTKQQQSVIINNSTLIQTHPRCGECRCISTNEKVLVIFTVRISENDDDGHEMERGLARLFLQQFAGAQKQVAQNSPHCVFRSGNDTPIELSLSDQNDGDRDSKQQQHDQKLPLGYLSFTFFPMHLKTQQRLDKAVELMVNFLPYLDKHLKSTKSFMHSRMRAKKNDLLRELKEDAVGSTTTTTTTTSSSISKLVERPTSTASAAAVATTHGGGYAGATFNNNKKKYGSSSSSSSFGGQQQMRRVATTTTTGWKKSSPLTTTTTTTRTATSHHHNKYVSKHITTSSSEQHNKKHYSKPHHFVPKM